MVYNLVDEDISTAKNGVTALHTEIDSLVMANNSIVGTAGLTYTYDDTTKKATCTGGSVSGVFYIPAFVKHNGNLYKVIEIGSNAFKDNAAITSVSLSSELCKIGSKAFQNCTSLLSVELRNNGENKTTNNFNLSYIGSSAFEGCSSLGGIDEGIPPVGTRPLYLTLSCPILIDSKAFKGTNFTKVVIDSPSISIYDYAFQNCTSLTTVQLDYLSYNDNNVFDGCTSLATVSVTNDRTLPITVPTGANVDYYRRIKNPMKKYIHSVHVAPKIWTVSVFNGVIKIINDDPSEITNLSTINSLTEGQILSVSGYVWEDGSKGYPVTSHSKVDVSRVLVINYASSFPMAANTSNLGLRSDMTSNYDFLDIVYEL